MSSLRVNDKFLQAGVCSGPCSTDRYNFSLFQWLAFSEVCPWTTRGTIVLYALLKEAPYTYSKLCVGALSVSSDRQEHDAGLLNRDELEWS